MKKFDSDTLVTANRQREARSSLHEKKDEYMYSDKIYLIDLR